MSDPDVRPFLTRVCLGLLWTMSPVTEKMHVYAESILAMSSTPPRVHAAGHGRCTPRRSICAIPSEPVNRPCSGRERNEPSTKIRLKLEGVPRCEMKNVNNETVGHPTHFDDKREPGHGESRSAQRGVILSFSQHSRAPVSGSKGQNVILLTTRQIQHSLRGTGSQCLVPNTGTQSRL